MRKSLLLIANSLPLLRAQVSGRVAELAASYCSAVSDLTSVDPTDAQVTHMFVGDTNILYEMLQDSSCSNLSDCIMNYPDYAVQPLLRTGIGILFALATLLVYFLVAAPCACCRCCRRLPIWCCWSERRFPRNMGKKTKMFLLTTFFIYVGALAADVVYSLRYRAKLHDGSQSFLCEAFQFSDNLLNGYSSEDGSHVFLGVENVHSAIENVTEVVDANSPQLQSVVTIVDQTSPITYALDEFLLYLNHMNQVLGDPQNNDIGSYECVFCRSCCQGSSESMIEKSISSISQTVAASLSQVRVQVQEALSGDTLESVRSSLTSSEKTIGDVKSEVEKSIDSVLISNRDTFESIVSYIDLGTLVIIASMGLPTLLLFIVVFVGVCRSHEKSLTDPDKKVRNPCFASCSWCITFLYAFVLFLLAGVLGIGSYILASSCDIIADPDEFVTSTLPQILSMADFPSSAADTILRTCATSAGSGDLLSAIKISDTSNKTVREMLDITGPINAEFEKLSSMADSASGQFATNPDIVTLLDALGTFGSMYTMKQSFIERLSTDASLAVSAGLVSAVGFPTINSLLDMAIRGIPDCGDRRDIALGDPAISSAFESILGLSPGSVQDFEGLNSFVLAIQAAGINIGTHGNVCPWDFINLTPSDVSLANPFHKLVAERTAVLTHVFRCDDLQVSPHPDTGKATSMVVSNTCNFDQSVSYITSLQSALRTKAQAVDNVQQATIDQINTDLRSLIQTDVLPRIDYLLNSLDCKFVYERYKDTVEALCWKEVPGLIGSVLTWLVFSGLCLIAIIIEFVIWRHLRDNLSLWYDVISSEKKAKLMAGSYQGSDDGTMMAAAGQLSPTAEMQAGIGYEQFQYT